MVVLLLCVKLESAEGIESVSLPPDYEFCFDVKDPRGFEERERVTMSAAQTFDIPDSRGHANFLVRFEGSNHFSSMNVQEVKKVTRPITAEDEGNYVPLIAFECRGVEPVKWYPTAGFIVKASGSSGKTFEKVDLSDDWCDFDEGSNKCVGIYGINYEFRVHKK